LEGRNASSAALEVRLGLRASAPKGPGPPSLLEQILKRLPRIVGPQGGWSGGFLLAGDTKFVERAIVAHVFLLHALGDRSHALEAAAGIEVRALLAGVQFETALGTKARGRHPLQDRAALRTSRDGMGSRQIYRSRSEGIVSLRRRRARFFAGPLPRLLLPIAILISMLTVFSCHKTSPRALAYCRASRVLRQAGNPTLSVFYSASGTRYSQTQFATMEA
jgi:hypothetical protein